MQQQFGHQANLKGPHSLLPPLNMGPQQGARQQQHSNMVKEEDKPLWPTSERNSWRWRTGATECLGASVTPQTQWSSRVTVQEVRIATTIF